MARARAILRTCECTADQRGRDREQSAHTNDFPGSLAEAGSIGEEEIAILEANLDDLNPQLIGYIVEQVLAEGALDVFTTPVQMKKNRPGTLLTILASPEQEEQTARAAVSREQHAGHPRASREALRVWPRRHETRRDAMGRSSHEDRQHERHRLAVRARIRGLPAHCRRASRPAEDGDAGSASACTWTRRMDNRPKSSTSPRRSITSTRSRTSGTRTPRWCAMPSPAASA